MPRLTSAHLGNDAMKDRWLPIAATGDGLFCIGISETEAGSAVGHMRARLTPDGDGYRLNAYKNYVTGGHKAGACLVWCRFPESSGTKGIGAVMVDLSAPGVTVTGTHVKMGLRATRFSSTPTSTPPSSAMTFSKVSKPTLSLSFTLHPPINATPTTTPTAE